MTYTGAVLDLDGTIYHGDELVPGADAAVAALRAAGVEVVFFSNNPTMSREAYAARLGELGIDVSPERVLSAGTVTARYLRVEHGRDAVFLVGSDGLREQLEAAGVTLVADATAADVLVASWDRAFGYDDMLAGYRALEAGATFYGTDPDRLVPTDVGLVPGSGAIINAVAGTIEREPTAYLGKPSAAAREAVLELLDAPASQCLVVGDRLSTDVALGEAAGMTTVLVRTGVSTDADLETSDYRPDHVIDSVADLPDLL